MTEIQIFIWYDWSGEEETPIAKLEVYHQIPRMVLWAFGDTASIVREKMAELHEDGHGMYANEETTEEGNSLAQFIIEGDYNWNCRWRDFRVILNQLLGTFGYEDIDEDNDEWYDDAPMVRPDEDPETIPTSERKQIWEQMREGNLK